MNLAEALHRSPAFECFTESELRPLERAMEVLEFQDGDVLIEEGERGDSFYVIIEGTIRVTHRTGDGDVLNLGTMKEGEIFGLVALIDNEPRSATCSAAGRVKVATLPASAFQLLYLGDTPWAYHFQYMVARQLAKDARSLNRALLSAILAGGDPAEAPPSDALSYDFRLTIKE